MCSVLSTFRKMESLPICYPVSVSWMIKIFRQYPRSVVSIKRYSERRIQGKSGKNSDGKHITDKHQSIKTKEKREKSTSCRNVTWHVSRSRRQDDQWLERYRISFYRWSSQINHRGKCTKTAKFDTRWSNSLIWLVWQDQLRNIIILRDERLMTLKFYMNHTTDFLTTLLRGTQRAQL